jgi:hypothetical protein
MPGMGGLNGRRQDADVRRRKRAKLETAWLIIIKSKNPTFPHSFSDFFKNIILRKINPSEVTRNQNVIATMVLFSSSQTC